MAEESQLALALAARWPGGGPGALVVTRGWQGCPPASSSALLRVCSETPVPRAKEDPCAPMSYRSWPLDQSPQGRLGPTT